MDYKREFRSMKLLALYCKNYSVNLAFWTLADSVCRRANFGKLLKFTNWKRREICKDYLRHEYADELKRLVLENHDEITDSVITENLPVWVFWWQGDKALPYPLDICINSIKEQINNREVYVVTSDNITEFIEVPNFMMRKVEKGDMSYAHFADYIRICLLEKYGGLWIDSAFFLVDNIGDKINGYRFYSIKHGGLRPWVASYDLWSIGLLACAPHYRLMRIMKGLFEAYWSREKVEIAYLFSDYMISLVYDLDAEFRRDIEAIPDNNKDCFVMHEIGDEIVNVDKLNKLTSDNDLFQLTYKKVWKMKKNGEDTFFSALIK